MTRPLTRHRSGGPQLTRPPEIEAAVVVADGLPRDEQLRRARLHGTDLDSLPPEVVVYLIRNARRADDEILASQLLGVLHRRCAASLLRWVADTAPNADEIRQAVLDDLNDLFVNDVGPNGARCDHLDFYEVRFYQALKMLWRMAIRRVKPRAEKERQLPDGDAGELTPGERAVSAQVKRGLEDMARGRLPADQKVALNMALETLPADLAETVKLIYVDGLDTGSEDPKRRTAATELGISRPAVEKRLKKALAMLRKRMEADHG